MSLFRKEALRRLSSPEELDRSLAVTTSKGWVAVAALLAAAAAVVAWSIEGEVSDYVEARGILLNGGGRIVDAVAAGSGTLVEIAPAAGDAVEKDQLVARIANYEAMERYRGALELVERRKREIADLERADREEDALIDENARRQRERLEQLEQSGRQSVEAARTRLEDHRRLFAENVVTRLTVERSQQAFDRAQRALFDTLRQRDELEARELRRDNERRTRMSDAEARLETAEARAGELETLIDTQRVLAPAAGRVIEIKAAPGAVLAPGASVLSIESGAEELEMLIYLPSIGGKRVAPGMEVLVSPSTARREKYGAMKGVVEEVSAFPASLESIVAMLQNRALAESMTAAGPLYAGRVALVPDPATASGFAWTSPRASNETITAGTLATAEVKLSGEPPIALVAPLVKEALGL